MEGDVKTIMKQGHGYFRCLKTVMIFPLIHLLLLQKNNH